MKPWIAACAAATLGLLASACADRNVVARFENGPGDDALGLSEPATDALGYGPTAIAVDASGRVHVLDATKSRVVSMDAGGGARRTETVAGVAWPADLAAVQDRLYVFDQATGQVKGVAPPAGGAGDGREAGGSGDLAAALFRQTGLGVQVQEASGQAELGGEAAGPYRYVGRSEQPALVLGPDGSVVRYRLERDGERAGTLRVNPERAPPYAIPLRTRGDLVSASIVGLDRAGDTYVLTEEDLGGDGAANIRQTLRRHGRNGVATAEYALPASDPGIDVARSVAVAPDGKVYALKVTLAATEVLRLAAGRPAAEAGPALPPTTQPGAAPPAAAPASERPQGEGLEASSRTATMTRAAAREEARRYVTHRWRVTPTAYAANRTSTCKPTERKYWQRPRRLQTALNAEVQGLPYCWGCADTVEQFTAALSSGRKVAGNTCTCRNGPCALADTAGVDCSGFVSNVLHTGRYGTTGLIQVTDPVRTQAELRPMDIYNKAGSHVVFFDGFVEGPTGRQVRIFESSVSCGGTCQRVVPLSHLNGYAMRRRKGIVD